MNIAEKYDMAVSDMAAINKQMSSGEGVFADTVTVQHEDGSYFRFNYATLVELDIEGEHFVVVHTEHNGANVFFREDVAFFQINNGEIEIPNKEIS